MKKKKKYYTGYAVVTEDFTATSFSDRDIETCKRYCRMGYVIIRTYSKTIGHKFRIYWHKWYKPFEFKWRWRRINILRLHIDWDVVNIDEWEKEVVWRPGMEEEEV